MGYSGRMFSFRVLAGVVNCESDHSVDTGGSCAMVTRHMERSRNKVCK